MRRKIRSALLLIVFFGVLAAAGGVALHAISFYGGLPVRRGLVSARLDDATEEGLLQLHTLETVRLPTQGAPLTVPAGTVLRAAAAVLISGDAPPPDAPPGSKLRCALRVDPNPGQRVEVVRCTVGSPDERN